MSERYTIGPSRTQSFVKNGAIEAPSGEGEWTFSGRLGAETPRLLFTRRRPGFRRGLRGRLLGLPGALLSAAKIRSVAMR